MGNVRNNKLVYALDRDRIEEQFDVFRLSWDKSSKMFSSELLDCHELNNRVQSISISRQAECFIMMLHHEENDNDIRQIVQEKTKSVTVQKMSVFNMDDITLMRLLINGTNNYTCPWLSFSNITGHLYTLIGSEEQGNVRISVEIYLDQDGFISLPVKSFTSSRLQDRIAFGKYKWKDYPKYIIRHGAILRKTETDEKALTFINRSPDKTRHQIKYFNVMKYSEYQKTKMGVLSSFIQAFNERYKGLAEIKGTQLMPDVIKIECPKQVNAYKESNEHVRCGINEVTICDLVGNEDSERTSAELAELFMLDSIAVSIRNKTSKTGLNVVLVHEKSFYKDKDPYAVTPGIIAQHITVEMWTDSATDKISVYRTIKNQLLIKEDIANGRINAIDWDKCRLPGTWIFGAKTASENEDDTACFMTVHENGTISFKIINENNIPENETEMEMYGMLLEYPEAECIFLDNEENLHTITDTKEFTIPEIMEISRLLKEISQIPEQKSKKKPGLKGKRTVKIGDDIYENPRDLFLSALTDINYYRTENGIRYCIGEPGNGMKGVFASSIHIRELDGENAESVFLDLIPMMQTVITRNGKMSVLPLPCKYIREYVNYMY